MAGTLAVRRGAGVAGDALVPVRHHPRHHGLRTGAILGHPVRRGRAVGGGAMAASLPGARRADADRTAVLHARALGDHATATAQGECIRDRSTSARAIIRARYTIAVVLEEP